MPAPERRPVLRRLQLTILITTAVVLFSAGGYAMWHTWQEQELPREETIRPAYINVAPDGRIFYKSYEFDLSYVDPNQPDFVGLALEEALRESLGSDDALRRADGTWRVPIVIYADRKANPAHIERIRQACRTVGITDVTLKTP